jgi:uncharacterized protein involved in high-affinity Fe2+ transport
MHHETKTREDRNMKRNFFIIPLLVIALVAFQSVPLAHAEPVTLTVMAIAGLVAVFTAGSVDMIASDHDSAQAKAEDHQTVDLHSKSQAHNPGTDSGDSPVATQ